LGSSVLGCKPLPIHDASLHGRSSLCSLHPNHAVCHFVIAKVLSWDAIPSGLFASASVAFGEIISFSLFEFLLVVQGMIAHTLIATHLTSILAACLTNQFWIEHLEPN
jgi:hypothetical protein